MARRRRSGCRVEYLRRVDAGTWHVPCARWPRGRHVVADDIDDDVRFSALVVDATRPRSPRATVTWFGIV